VVEEFAVEAPKTRGLLDRLGALQLDDVLIVTETVDENLYLSARNLRSVDVVDVAATDPVSLLAHDKVLITVGALKKFEEMLA
jgi:large subunit ribosomal protein L4